MFHHYSFMFYSKNQIPQTNAIANNDTTYFCHLYLAILNSSFHDHPLYTCNISTLEIYIYGPAAIEYIIAFTRAPS